MKQVLQLASTGFLLATLASLAVAQENRVYRDGGNWIQEITGTLSAAKTVRIKVDVGSVQVQGGSQPGISFVIHSRA